MQSFQTFLDSFANHGAMILMVFILAFLFIRRVSELTMIGWNGFLDSLNRSGGHILVGIFIMLVGIVMLKIMLYDDGKYIVGIGAGILSRSMGTESVKPLDPNVQMSETTITKMTNKDNVPE